MRYDVSTVAWKEWRELVCQPGAVGARGGYQLDIVFVLFTAIGIHDLPPHFLVAVFVFPGLYSALVSRGPFSFAGERDLRTLAPILATRISGEALFLGKALFTVAYGWFLGLAALSVAAALTVWRRGSSEALEVLAGAATNVALFGFPAVALFSCLGLLVSMRSATAIQAQQRTALAFFAVVLVPAVVVGLYLLAMSRLRGRDWLLEAEFFTESLLATSSTTWMVIGVVALLSLNALVLRTGLAWSGRSLLTID